MKSKLLAGALAACALSAFAADKTQLNDRIRTLTLEFEQLQHEPGKSIPAEFLRQARGIILFEGTKAGFLFAYQGGGGVAMARQAKSQKWSPVTFVDANQASLGFQIGGEKNFFVILLMDTNATRLLTQPNFNVSAEASGTAGDQSSGVGTNLTSNERPVLVYSQRTGLFGGAAIQGGAITPDDKANGIYYGRFLMPADILFGNKVEPTPAAAELARVVNKYSRGRK